MQGRMPTLLRVRRAAGANTVLTILRAIATVIARNPEESAMLRVLESESSTASGMPDQGDAVLRLRLGRRARGFHGKLPAASGMTRARRRAGARRRDSSANPFRPDPRSGRSCVRLSFFLPVLALVLGGLFLIATAPATAQTVPGSPRNVQLAVGDASLTLIWQAPSSWAGTPIGYELDWSTGATAPGHSSTAWKRITPYAMPLAPTATRYRFTGTYGDHTVANGTKYRPIEARAFCSH